MFTDIRENTHVYEPDTKKTSKQKGREKKFLFFFLGWCVCFTRGRRNALLECSLLIFKAWLCSEFQRQSVPCVSSPSILSRQMSFTTTAFVWGLVVVLSHFKEALHPDKWPRSNKFQKFVFVFIESRDMILISVRLVNALTNQ